MRHAGPAEHIEAVKGRLRSQQTKDLIDLRGRDGTDCTGIYIVCVPGAGGSRLDHNRLMGCARRCDPSRSRRREPGSAPWHSPIVSVSRAGQARPLNEPKTAK